MNTIKYLLTQAALWAITGSVVAVLIAAGYAFYIVARLPRVDTLADYRPPVVSRVLGDDGSTIGEFFTERRIVVPLARMPQRLVQAFIAAEDANFYSHSGVDLSGIARAGLKNLLHMRKKEGGSTITQQVTKTLLLSPEKRFSRKIKEIILARRLESRLSKDEILFLYLNQIYLGAGAYGVQAASLAYFGKDVERLTLPEAALLAGLPKAPNSYSPLRNLGRARERQAYVLERMARAGFITRQEALAAARAPLALTPARQANEPAMSYPLEMLRGELLELVGEEKLYRGGLTITTSISPRMQRAAWGALRSGLKSIDRRGEYRGPLRQLAPADVEAELRRLDDCCGIVTGYDPASGAISVRTATGSGTIARRDRGAARIEATCPVPAGKTICPGSVIEIGRPGEAGRLTLEQSPEIQAALVALDPASGDVKAVVGGYDFRKSQFNRATQARRSAGSTFKPFVYAAGLAKGFSADSVFDDSPLEFPDGSGGAWHPRNYDDDYRGPVTMREALTRSINMVSIRVMEAVGASETAAYAARFGFAVRPEPHLTLALGATPVTPLEMATAYAVFADAGRLKKPRALLRVTDRDGRILHDAGPVTAHEIIDPSVAARMTGMLKSVVESGTGQRARALGRPVAGKTGTTNEARDAWFVGFTPQLAAAAWVGYDQERSIGGWASGGAAALPIWVDFMQAALAGSPRRELATSAAISRDAADGEEAPTP